MKLALAAAALALAAPLLTAPSAGADPPPNCAPKDWYQICAYHDGHYDACNMNFNGACQPMMAPTGPLPSGIPSPP
jgi:hypothetical protein